MTASEGGLFGFALRPVGGLILFCIGAVVVFGLGQRVSMLVMAPLCAELIAAGQACELVFTSPQAAFLMALKAALLAGVVLAVPCLMFQLSRLFAPTMFQHAPRATAAYAWAAGIIAVIGAAFVVMYEAPRAFSAALDHLAASALEMPMLGFATSYVRAALDMAGTYVALLQLPLILAMVVKSMRLKRQLSTEGPS
ncbi:MAG: twin-arginine translocase subunit TatC [Roseovarius sp.]